MNYDVVIAGGGPAGSTLGCLLRKYDPTIKVLIVEREKFPRDHVGESQLPAVCEILDEMGAWDKVEAANFPIKIGATYKWGITDDLWHFNFLLNAELQEQPRPAKYEGQRRQTAFQVDRSIYDQILLDHARELECDVLEEVGVVSVSHHGDKVTGFLLQPEATGSLPASWGGNRTVTANYYCDCTGGSLMRRTMNIGIDSPTSLRNVAIWDYWQNADWAETIGIGGTRIQIMSLGWGWMWFIPISETRTSLGLVTPVQYLRDSGKKLEELYQEAIQSEPIIAKLLVNAEAENHLSTTRDWSFSSDRYSGENWFLAGDSAGFADPILSAGLTLAQSGARRLAFTILELRKGDMNPVWLHREYESTYKFQISHHIRFADYWYSANAIFTDLKENCAKIAADAGLDLEADAAFQWLGTGGFARDTTPGVARAATWSLGTVKHMINRFSEKSPTWAISTNNTFRLCLDGAEKEYVSFYDQGRVIPIRSYVRGETNLPLQGLYHVLFDVLQKYSDLSDIADVLWRVAESGTMGENPQAVFASSIEVLEAMVTDGWVTASRNMDRPILKIAFHEEGYAMEFA